MSDSTKKSAENPQWQKFETAMRELVKVPYATVKATLEQEDKVRRRKRSRSAKVRAFRAANRTDQNG
jgi:hypothetical protein